MKECWRIKHAHSKEELPTPQRSTFNHRPIRMGKLIGSHPCTDKLTTVTGTWKWQKINIQNWEVISVERDSKLEEFNKICSFPVTFSSHLVDSVMFQSIFRAVNNRDVEKGLLSQTFTLSDTYCHKCLLPSTWLIPGCGMTALQVKNINGIFLDLYTSPLN